MSQVAPLSDRLSRELPELLELRRHLHAHPELSGEEHQTAALVAGELRQLGWRVREGVGRTGVVAELGPDHGPTVGPWSGPNSASTPVRPTPSRTRQPN